MLRTWEQVHLAIECIEVGSVLGQMDTCQTNSMRGGMMQRSEKIWLKILAENFSSKNL